MAFNAHPCKPLSRAQALVNLARGINTDIQVEDMYTSSDIFMSSRYDPTQSSDTLETNQNVFNIETHTYGVGHENTNISIFEELKDVTYEQELDPFVGQSEIYSNVPEIPNIIEIQSNDDFFYENKRYYILDEVTGQLKEDMDYFKNNINNDEYYLDEKTGKLELKINKGYSNKDDESIYFETESLSSDEEIHIKQREFNRLKRVRGEQYTGRKKTLYETEGNRSFELVTKPKKCLKDKPCTHSCISKSSRSYLCGLITETKRKAIFDYFWSLLTWDAKKAYLKNLVRLRPVVSRRKSTGTSADTSQKQLAYDYYIPDDQNVNIKVCKNFFISIFNIKSDTLSEWIKKIQDNVGIDEEKDLRSKHEKRQSKITTISVSKVLKSTTVKEWLNLLNKVPSHYCRSSSNRVYVEDTFESKSHMFRIYTEWCKDKQLENVGRKLFTDIVEQEKISIFKPRKDQCDVCTAKKEGNISEEQYTLHIQKKNEAYKALSDATAMSSSEVLVVTVDVQSVLLCPKILVSVQYYKQKLQVHNQSIYINNNKDVHLFVWHEGDGGVTANEFTSCLVEFIKSQSSSLYKKIIIISDGCSYQNRNRVLSSALLKLTKETDLEIEQLILEKGHTMMPVDSVHSTLERKFRPQIYSPGDYISRMREARLRQPYQVHHVDYSFFRNYEGDVCLDSIRPGKKAGDPTVNDIRGLLYKNGGIFYKIRHPDEWQILPQRIRTYNPTAVITQLYNEPRKIDKTKYDSLQSLKPYMHRDYHAFYDNLHYKA